MPYGLFGKKYPSPSTSPKTLPVSEEIEPPKKEQTMPVQITFDNGNGKKIYYIITKERGERVDDPTASSHKSYAQLFKTTLESGISALLKNNPGLKIGDINLKYITIKEYPIVDGEDPRVVLKYKSSKNGNKTYTIDISKDLKIDENTKNSINTDIKPKYEAIDSELDTALSTYITAMKILRGSLSPMPTSRTDDEDYKPQPIELNISTKKEKSDPMVDEPSAEPSPAEPAKPKEDSDSAPAVAAPDSPKEPEKEAPIEDPFERTDSEKKFESIPNVCDAREYFTKAVEKASIHW
ncbi:MAG: hypothetical protein KR126chlam6_00772 [Candidatus Anoxychlamydiales bacterium]|nr:hypothetical protein [Candidatus Anoxychlamydiales bacterium]